MSLLLMPCFPLRHLGETGQRSCSDSMNEDGTDHVCRGPDANKRPVRSIPYVHNTGESSAARLAESPFYVHSPGDTPDVAKPDCRLRRVETHLRYPPRGPVDVCRIPGTDWEGPVRRHLDDPAAAGPALAKSDIAVVRK